MIESTLSSLGKIGILCNNAGIMDGARPVAYTPAGRHFKRQSLPSQ